MSSSEVCLSGYNNEVDRSSNILGFLRTIGSKALVALAIPAFAAGCGASDNGSEQQPSSPVVVATTETATEGETPSAAEVSAALNRGKGLWISPGATVFEDGSVAVRPMAEVNGQVSCSPSEFGKQVSLENSNSPIYAYDKDSGSFTKVAAAGDIEEFVSRANIKNPYAECTQFGKEDAYDNNGVPIEVSLGGTPGYSILELSKVEENYSPDEIRQLLEPTSQKQED